MVYEKRKHAAAAPAATAAAATAPVVPEVISDMPEGRYRLIGWDIDTTGRRLIDEVFQVAAYYPNSKFAQYMMPHKDLSPFAERRYSIRVVTVSRYRMLKDLKRNKFLKTKSEIAALLNFITWLEKNKGDFNDGIILVYHEVKKISPAMFLEALNRYNLYDRFAAVVKGFCNTCTIAEIRCMNTLKSFSLKVLARSLLNEESDFRSAADRARTSYSIVQRLKQRDDKDDLNERGTGDATMTEQQLTKFAKQFTRSTNAELIDLKNLKGFLERQNSFLPIFKELMRYDWVSRQNAARLRCKLVEHELDFNQLKNAWDNGGRRALKELLTRVSTTTKKDHFDLIKILECYFDPKKKPVQPNFYKKRKTFSKTRRTNRSRY